MTEKGEKSEPSKDEDKNGSLVECVFIAFMAAIHADDIKMAMQLCRPGFIDRTDNFGMRPIHWVTELGHTDVLMWFIENDVDINAEIADDIRRRPIHLAAFLGHDLVLACLIAAGCDITAKDKNNMDALDYACVAMHPSCVDLLMDVQASTDQQNDGHDADGTADERAFDAFMEAIFNRDMQKVERIFLPDYLDRRFGVMELNPLHVAAQRGQQDMVQWLIKHGAFLDSTNIDGQTAAHLAAFVGHADVLQQLVDAGCKTDIVDKRGWAAMDCALLFGREECVRVLTKSQNKENSLANKIKEFMWSVFTEEKPIVVSGMEADGTLVRMMAVMSDMMRKMTSDEWMELMNDSKAKVVFDSTKSAAKLLLATCIHDDVLQLALERGYYKSAIDGMETDKDGTTLLKIATISGNVNAMRMLVTAGVDIEASDKDGQRATHFAAHGGHEEILRCLIDEGGCVIDAVNENGHTPLDIANQYGNRRCVSLLRGAMETRRKTEFTIVHLPSYSIVFRSHQIFDMDNAIRHIRELIISLNRPVVICHSAVLYGYLLSSAGTLRLISDGLGFEEYLAIGADTNRNSVESSVKQLREWDIRFMWDDNESDQTIPQWEVAVEIDKATADNWRDHFFVRINLRAEETDVTKETVSMLMMGTAAANEMKDVFIDFVKRRLRADLMMTADGCNARDTLTRMILMNNRLITFYDSRRLKLPSTEILNETVVATDGHVSVFQKCFDNINYLGGFFTNENMDDMLCQDYVLIRSVTEEQKVIVVPRRECRTASDVASKIESFLDIKGKLQLLCTNSVIDLNTAIDDVDDVIHYAVILPYNGVTNFRGKRLGRGGYGDVSRCTIPDSDKSFAIKRVRNDITSEILVAAKAGGHKRIMKYHRFYEEEPDFLILMDCMKESLSDHLKRNHPLSQEKILLLSRGILEGLKHLHDHKIIHRDLKGSNVLLDENDFVKLTDFGTSTFLDIDTIRAEHEGVNIRAGTYNYMAPEMMVEMTPQQAQSYGLKADIWSFGATMIEMVTGRPPFFGMEKTAIILKLHRTKAIDYKFPPRLDKELHDFIECCLNSAPNKRPNCFMLLSNGVFMGVDGVDAYGGLDAF